MRDYQAPNQLEKATPVLPGDGQHADTKVFNEKDCGDISNVFFGVILMMMMMMIITLMMKMIQFINDDDDCDDDQEDGGVEGSGEVFEGSTEDEEELGSASYPLEWYIGIIIRMNIIMVVVIMMRSSRIMMTMRSLYLLAEELAAYHLK